MQARSKPSIRQSSLNLEIFDVWNWSDEGLSLNDQKKYQKFPYIILKIEKRVRVFLLVKQLDGVKEFGLRT